MWDKIKGFFKGLWDNKKTTAASIVPLATAAAVSYGMATGVVPVTPQTIGLAATSASSGVGLLLAKDAKKSEEVTKVVDTAGTIAVEEVPTVISVVEQVNNMKKDAEDGQKKIETYTAVINSINEIANKEQQAK